MCRYEKSEETGAESHLLAVLDLGRSNPKGPAMNDRTDIGHPLPVGHPSGRFWPVPESVEQARARVLDQMDHLEMAVRDGIDVGYAMQCLDETLDDYREMVISGTVTAK